jgi:DNA ligase-1
MNNRKFISRLGNVFSAPEWFTKDLPTDETLDGELFGGRKQFQSTGMGSPFRLFRDYLQNDMRSNILLLGVVGIVKSQGESERWKRLKYMIFDIPSKEASPFEQRLATLKSMFPNPSNPSHVEIVEQTLCKSKDQLMLMLESVQDQGGEGLMLRQPKSKYVGSRSNTLLKVKTFQDDEVRISQRNGEDDAEYCVSDRFSGLGYRLPERTR